jgi:DNA-binding response OmpR family regulator
LLAILAARPGRAISFGEFLTAIWGTQVGTDQAVVRSAIKRLRAKLAAARAEIVIEAVQGFGFRILGSAVAA